MLTLPWFNEFYLAMLPNKCVHYHHLSNDPWVLCKLVGQYFSSNFIFQTVHLMSFTWASHIADIVLTGR